MRSTLTLRFSSKRLFLLTLISLVAVAALLGIAASANKGNRAARARAELAANSKSAINPAVLNDKQPNAPAAAAIVATLTDNVTAATKVAPGGTINYTATITNNGAVVGTDDATNLNFSAPLDANTTLVPGSIHASPIARNDTYNWVGNTQLDTAARALPAVTGNDVAVNAPAGTDTFTVTAIAGGATSLGGTVTLASPSGTFTYTPPLNRPNAGDGAAVNDTFTYTIVSSADPSLTSTGTVTITLTGRVFYLQAGAAGDGRSNTPSSNPATLSTNADKASDIFYIFSNAGSLSGLFTVDAGQQLLGQGVALVINIPVLGSTTLFPAVSAPTTTNGAGNCVTLAGAPGNNTLSGFDIGNCTGGTAITGANVGTLNVSTLSINTNGGALDLTGVGAPTASVVLGGLTSTGGAKNVNLVGLNGTFTLASGGLSGATNNGFDVNGGTAGITYGGTISNSTARQVSIVNKTGGTVALSGAISGTGTGIFLNANSGGSIINLTGGVVLSTGTNAAFTATNSGTVSVTGANNTIASTSGTPLNITTTTIGASGVTFKSIACNGATNGIVLNGTGAVGLTVTGDGASDPANTTRGNTTAKLGGGSITLGSGGTIQNTTGSGVLLTNTNNLVLTSMNITNAGGAAVNSGNNGITANTVGGMTLDNIKVTGSTGNSGLRGSEVIGLSMQHVDIDGNGTAVNTEVNDNWNVRLDNLTGTASALNSLFFNSREDIFSITNSDSGGAHSLNLTITNSEFRDTDLGSAPAVGDTAFKMFLTGSSNCVTTINAKGSTFKNARTTGFQYNGSSANSSGTINVGDPIVAANGNVFEGNGVDVDLSHQGTGTTLNFDVSRNTMRQTLRVNASNSVNINMGGLASNATMIGTIKSNVIGNPAVANSGSDLGAGIAIDAKGVNSTVTATVTSNIVNQVKAFSGNVFDAGMSQTGKLNLKLRSNTFNGNPAQANPQYGIHVNGGTGTPGENNPLCYDIGQNTVSMPASAIATVELDSFPGNVTNLVGYAGGANNAGQIATFFTANNTLTGPAPFYTGAGGTTQAAVAPCSTFVFPTAPAPVDDSVLNRNEFLDGSTSAYAMAQVKAESVATPVAPAVANVAPASRSYRATLGNVMHHAISTLSRAAHTVDSMITPTAYAQNPAPNAPTSGEVVSLNTIATFPAGGKSITIKYSATVNTPPLARSVSTQGTVSGGNFANVLTDDPEPAGAANPTVTLVDTLMTWNGVTSTDWNTATNWTQPAGGTQYVPGVSNPAVNDVVIPTVGTQPTISAPDIGIYSLSVGTTMTLTITNPRVLTVGGSPGGDLTLFGTISGGNLNLGTGIHGINNPVGTGTLSATNVATVLSGSTVLLNDNLQAGALVVNAGGNMTILNRTLSLNGSGPALVVPGGATFTTTGSTVIFNGTAAQQAAGIAYNNLTINNSIGAHVTGVTLQGNATVNGVLTLTSSDLATTGAFTLTMPAAATSGPASGATDVVGNVKRTGFVSGGSALSFGNPFNTIKINSGAAPADINILLAKNAPVTYAGAVLRSYTITPNGANGPATLRLHYRQTELNGNLETPTGDFNLRKGPSWSAVIPTARNVGVAEDNWLENNAVTTFSEWTMAALAPSATGGVVTGRIVDSNGAPVEGAVVRLAGTQNRKFITDANGFYRFENVETNGFYIVTPARANYTFSPSSRSFSQIGESTEAAFGATLSSSGFVNPLDTPEYFVRQHYVDFLGREPDEAGFNFWSDQIIECGFDSDCVERRRENVSAAYFLSIEFQETGGLVDGIYRASYGVRPNFGEFMPDTRAVGLGVVVGTEGWQARLQANKQAFVAAFAERPAFVSVYGNMDNSLFVDTLIGHAGGTFTAGERDALVSGLANGTQTRPDVLRSIAENNRFVNAKFNDAFVMMEYFGYLRRDPDASGYAFWLNKLNEFNGNFERAEMVKAFIVSGEFRDRFPR